MAALNEALAKKGGLTLSQLASYDDLITDALVDHVYFWTAIRKNRGRYFASRGLREEDIAKILQECVILEKDCGTAVDKLLQVDGLRKFNERLRTKDERLHFRSHLRRYVDIYRPDCPFEVNTTNRYTIATHEASVTARKDIKKGDAIKYLTGIQVAMTEQELEDLDLTRRDFSIVLSSRKKTPSLFLGPARFANHDCDANAKLSTTGAHGMQIIATKNIEVGDEITVVYGDDYFGEDNCECLCLTCEKYLRNGWGPLRKDESDDEDEEASPSTPEEASDHQEQQPDPEPYSFRRKRRYGTNSASGTPATTPHDSTDGQRKRRKVAETPSPASATPKRSLRHKMASPKIKREDSSSQLSQLDTSPGTAHKRPGALRRPSRFLHNPLRSGLLSASSEDSETERYGSPASTLASSQPSTDATSIEDTIVVKPLLSPRRKLASVETLTVPAITVCSQTDAEGSTADDTTRGSLDDDDSELSDLSDRYTADDTLGTMKRKRRRRHLGDARPPPRTRSSSNLPPTIPIPTTENSNETSDNPRKPGDYTLTPLLLGQKYSRWVQCGTCEDDFVQTDAYLTRIACARCERHSKLYGYEWPKTDKEGKHDKEQRVLDHREVNRFVAPTEEKEIRKGSRKSLVRLIAERQESERTRTESSEAESPRRCSRKRTRLSS